ncbi:hypothetical protein [Sutterella sp.]|uniref:hypothetical protein n=1 Tax=Sutterella sp. TaxID=1981025 RepID=UPI0026E06CDF|nr:hypothetical protein [Sutterella sp.]MDO5531824.1 hypothetical protein [Sutterella sp.]
MKYITYWNAEHTVSRIILREDAPELGDEAPGDFLARRFGAQICALNPNLRSLLELDGRPDVDQFHCSRLSCDLLEVSRLKEMPPDAFVWVLEQSVPPAAFRDPSWRSFMVWHDYIRHWDIHPVTIRRYRDEVQNRAAVLAVGILVFTKDLWAKSRSGKKPFTEANCLAVAKPLCHHLNKILTGVKCRVVELSHEAAGVSAPGLTVAEAGDFIRESGSPVVFPAGDFEEVRTESSGVHWKLSPDLWVSVGHEPAGEDGSQGGWVAMLCRGFDGRIEKRAETERLESKEAAAAEAARRWPGIRMTNDDEEYAMSVAAVGAVRTGIPVLDGWLWEGGVPGPIRLCKPDDLMEDLRKG